jgi:non-homologous end joining protein Ku
VAGSDIDPVYFDSPYFVYPDGPIAVEVLRVIGAAMAKVVSSVSGALPSAGASGWSW